MAKPKILPKTTGKAAPERSDSSSSTDDTSASDETAEDQLEEFVPSEAISADLAISFPVDI